MEKLVIATNAEPRELKIPIQGVASAGDIAASPTTLDLVVNAGDSQTLDLTLTNVGTAPGSSTKSSSMQTKTSLFSSPVKMLSVLPQISLPSKIPMVMEHLD